MIVLQRYSKVENTYSSGIIIFVHTFDCIVEKTHRYSLNRCVSAGVYLFILTGGRSVTNLIICVCIQNDVG